MSQKKYLNIYYSNVKTLYSLCLPFGLRPAVCWRLLVRTLFNINILRYLGSLRGSRWPKQEGCSHVHCTPPWLIYNCNSKSSANDVGPKQWAEQCPINQVINYFSNSDNFVNIMSNLLKYYLVHHPGLRTRSRASFHWRAGRAGWRRGRSTWRARATSRSRVDLRKTNVKISLFFIFSEFCFLDIIQLFSRSC